jgi:phage shock protein PspC (stress-responsive transcriptional regulator)
MVCAMNEPPRKRLLRSTDDRVLAGVAGGIARYLDIDPTLVRVGFVAAVLFGGLGIVAYLVLAVVTPNDDGSGAPVEGDRPSPWLIVLAVLAVLILLPGPFWGPFDWGIGWWWGGSVWLLLLAAAGVWLYMTTRDRRRGTPPSSGAASGAGSGPGPGSEPGQRSEPATAVTEAHDRPRARGDAAGRVLRAIAIAVLIFAALNVAAAVAGVSAWATATGHGEIVAGVVIAFGAALVGAAFIGDARWRWLLVPALVLALPAGAVAAADVRFDGGIGERDYRPTSAAQVPDDGYSLGIGQLVVDLRGLPWHNDQSLDLATDMGVGQTVVSVPSGVCVQAEATASAGDVFVRGQRSSGIDAEVVEHPPEGSAPRLVLDSELDAGQIVVSDRPPEDLSENRHGFGSRRFDDLDEGADEERASAQRACER